jgi:hypothetical protein
LAFNNARRHRIHKFTYIILLFALVYAVLLIPGDEILPPKHADRIPFIWNQDAYWKSLEEIFRAVRNMSRDSLNLHIETKSNEIDSELIIISSAKTVMPDDPRWREIEKGMFELGPEIAANPEKLDQYANLFGRLRNIVKSKSTGWEMNSQIARDRIYRLIYGGRAAIEEIMLQAPPEKVRALYNGLPESSQTPSATMLGVTIHSGDILVSRGGAPTSALIARGNDYPGNFSHVALAFIDSTGKISILEAHIERGVTISSLDKYLRDTKLRIMVLRLRSNLPQLIRDPMLPHKAASLALRRAEAGHIAYDFEMDFNDHKKLFCSEVASAPYDDLGVKLWMGTSSISTRGISSWLSKFGVTHFETQEPSDLEYDPQLTVVAEWRDPETLFKDHIDNAIIDEMLGEAENGQDLKYDWYMLPIARAFKAYSMVLNLAGEVGPVPEGMTAKSALYHKWFNRKFSVLKAQVLLGAEEFNRDNGYIPPYWELVDLARKAGRHYLGSKTF